MQYIRYDDNGYHLDGYLTYLDSVRDRIPPNAKQYAFAPWRYQIHDHRCPHDSWLTELQVKDIFEPTTRERTLELHADFLGSYHDLTFEIVWRDVRAYSLGLANAWRGKTPVGHSDWMIDELLVEDSGLLGHEIVFSDSGPWKISCADLTYTLREG